MTERSVAKAAEESDVTGVSSSDGRRPSEAEVEIYKEICANIRTTDDISFKLLATIPIVAGFISGALAVWERSALEKNVLGTAPVVVFCLIGACITNGLMRWELRNVQKCTWLIDRAADFERRMFRREEPPKGPIQFDGWNAYRKPLCSMFDRPWGKEQSEKLIYSAAVAVWFVPLVMALWTVWAPAA